MSIPWTGNPLSTSQRIWWQKLWLSNEGTWCRGRDSNPHGITTQGILSPSRLPIPPPRLFSPFSPCKPPIDKIGVFIIPPILNVKHQVRKRRRADSNRRIGVLQTPALTTWLRRHRFYRAGNEIQTCDLALRILFKYSFSCCNYNNADKTGQAGKSKTRAAKRSKIAPSGNIALDPNR